MRVPMLVLLSLVVSAVGDESCSEEDVAMLQVSRGCTQQYPGCNNNGNNMNIGGNGGWKNSATDCQNWCSSTSGCVGWTYIDSNQGTTKQCWLKDSGVQCNGGQCDQNTQYTTYVSGYCGGECGGPGPSPTPSPSPSPSGGCSPISNCNNNGNNMNIGGNGGWKNSATDCMTWCTSTSGCTGYTYIDSNQGTTKQCWLKTNPQCCSHDDTQYSQYWSGFCGGSHAC